MVDRLISSETSLWRVVLDQYYKEELSAAFQLAEEIGVGAFGIALQWFRLIEAEYRTTEHSTVESLEPGLELEFVPGEVAELVHLRLLVRDDVRAVCGRLGIDERPPCRVTVLASESDAPWATSPFGYCIEKVPFVKVCLPHHLLDDHDRMREAVRHEYAHVLTVGIGRGHVPRWLSEAISTLVEGDSAGMPVPVSAPRWFSPSEIGEVFTRVHMPAGRRWVSRVMGSDWASSELNTLQARGSLLTDAYSQCTIIGRYLGTQFGEASVGRLLAQIGREDLGTVVRSRILGQDPVKIAIKRVYGLTIDQLFEAARLSIRT